MIRMNALGRSPSRARDEWGIVVSIADTARLLTRYRQHRHYCPVIRPESPILDPGEPSKGCSDADGADAKATPFRRRLAQRTLKATILDGNSSRHWRCRIYRQPHL
jgi:hypothetical protein